MERSPRRKQPFHENSRHFLRANRWPSTPPPSSSSGSRVPHSAQDKAAAASPTPAPSLSPAEKKALAADVAEVKTADQLWSYIEEWANKEPVLDDALDDTARQKKITEFVESERARLDPACEEFLKLYPKDPRRWDVPPRATCAPAGRQSSRPAGLEKTLQEVAARAGCGAEEPAKGTPGFARHPPPDAGRGRVDARAGRRDHHI